MKPKKDPQKGTIKTYAQIAPIDYVDIDEATMTVARADMLVAKASAVGRIR